MSSKQCIGMAASSLNHLPLTPTMLASELPTYDKVIPALLEVGIDGLPDQCKLTPGVPLKPMLAKPTKAIGEVLDRFENKHFTCEYKYDGERAQVCSRRLMFWACSQA